MLTIGSRLGPYEILAPLGKGGMGEVFRARDTRLDREVAIKLLPALLADDRGALQRLQQEARALAALSHPNLLSIFDVGTSDDGALYLVCELLEGETLRARLGQGVLPVREAISMGAAVAHGLAAAHGQGIVHRDLKPENIFCTNDGRVKILDFGLAKLLPATGPEAATLAGGAGTEAGVVLGTLGYMAPEQARGQAADARSDIFSLGAVLYEMMSGRSAFRRETPADTISAILREEPPELELADSRLAVPLQRIVRHCLEKNPARRFQSADDLAFALESVGETHSTGSLQAADMRAAAAVPLWRLRRLRFAVLSTLGLILAVAGGWWLGGGRRTAAAPQLTPITFRQGTIRTARFLPDGQTIVGAGEFNGDSRFRGFSVQADTPGMQFLGGDLSDVLAVAPGVAAVLQHTRNLAGFQAAGTLALMPLGGGAPRPILENIEDATFAPVAGTQLANAEAPPLLIVRYHPDLRQTTLEFPAGQVLASTSGWFSSPRFSPNGRWIALLEHPQFGDDAGMAVILDRSGRQQVEGPHFASTQGLAWSPDGKELWYTAADLGLGRNVYALSFSGHNRMLLSGPGSFSLEDTRPDGEALVRNDDFRISAIAVSPQYPQGRDVTVLNWANTGAVSPDGKDFLVGDESAGVQYATFLQSAQGSPPVRLGPGDAVTLSSDDAWALSLVPSASGASQLWLLPTGAGTPRQLTHGDWLWSESANFVPGRQLVVAEGSLPGHSLRAWLIGWDGSAKPLTPEGVYGFAVSPDGKYVLAVNQSGAAFLAPVDGGPLQPAGKWETDLHLMGFGPDDHTVYAGKAVNHGFQILRCDLSNGSEQPVLTVAPPQSAGMGAPRLMGVSRDAKSYLYGFDTDMSTLYKLRGLH